ncbi:MAG TPA: hypothetical protein VEI73_03210 [Candidatus Acidoferrum sp.]|nr:hypothetical protein [Candidatus Acidoferrum sp.]
MGLLDSIVSSAFRNEAAGRVVVFSGDQRNRGYIVRSAADELKIKSFLKMFYFAHFYILLLGMMLANAWSSFVVHLEGMGRPIEHMARNMGIALGVYFLVTGLPYLFLWRSYKKALPTFVSAQDAVVVSAQSRDQKRWIWGLTLIGLAFLILAAGIALMVRAK